MSLSAVLAAATTIFDSIGKNESLKAKEEYDKKLRAWTEYNERVEKINAHRRYQDERRRTMAQAIGDKIPVMSKEPLTKKSKLEMLDAEAARDGDSWAAALSRALGSIGKFTKDYDIKTSDIPIIGPGYDAYQGAREAAPAATSALNTSPSSIGRDFETHEYAQRYNPERRLS